MRVAIVGVSQLEPSPGAHGQNAAELVHRVMQGLFKNTGASFEDIDCTISASSDFTDGRTISDMAIQDVVQAVNRPESKVSMDGAFAVAHAAMRIRTGQFKTALVVAHGKSSEARNPTQLTNAAFDPIYARPLGIDQVAACALQARAMLAARSLTEELSAEVAAKAWGCARAAVVDSPSLATPLRNREVAHLSDGACGLLLAAEAEVHRFTKQPIWLNGFGYASDAYALGDRDLTRARALEAAAHQAYRMAEVKDVRELDVQVIEQGAYTSYQEAQWLEGLGLAERGHGAERYLSSEVNASGGGLRSHPGFATGLYRVCEAVTRLRASRSRHALAHGSYGIAGQSHALLVLSQ